MLKQSGKTDSVQALYATWIFHNQDNPLLFAVLFNYSVTLSDAGQLDAAQNCLQKAIAINPEFIPPYINLGRIYERQGKPGMAIAQWSAALAKTSAIQGTAITHKTTALNQSARALEAANQDEAAEDYLKQSLDIDPHQREVVQHLMALRQRQCKRPVLAATERASMEMLIEGMSPLSAAAYTDDPLFQLAVGAHYNRLDVGTLTEAALSWPKAEASSAPLKIGYLSSDLRDHAVGYLIAEVFGLHDRSKVEVFAYYCGPEAKDTLHQSFQGSVDHWVSIRDLDDVAAAKQISDDGIQILVDLNGYTREARLKLVALRPAPVIVNWLGFPGSMASPYHHYILADEWIIPENHEMFYSEKVLRLPCYQPNNRKRVVAPKQQTRSEVGLPENAMVYCCFNGAHKINRFTFNRWMSILAQVPDSVLWLLDSSESVNERLRGYAAEQGIAPERLIFAQKAANPYHLARYVLADLILDTTPYGAHTTASDALWMGVPVLTLSGRSFASRVCGSLVRSAGLPELITTTADAFVNLAVELGTDRALLQSFRSRLSEQRDTCTLFDTPLLVGELERLYQQMWNQYKAGELPRPDLANLDDYLKVGSQISHEEIEVQMVDDYQGWWGEKLALRSRFRPIAADQRLVPASGFRSGANADKALGAYRA
jgi:predicted O-linked N-acetylglucosamine transferase (SPINDLY family)